MELREVVGIHNHEFVSKDTGAVVSGKNLFLAFEDGKKSEMIFVTHKKLDGLQIKAGDIIEFYYNRFGKIETIKLTA
jgi:hypothetical protein